MANRKELVKLLALIYEEMPDLYAEIEKNALYPDSDGFDDEAKHDIAVDNAELRALAEIIEEVV